MLLLPMVVAEREKANGSVVAAVSVSRARYTDGRIAFARGVAISAYSPVAVLAPPVVLNCSANSPMAVL